MATKSYMARKEQQQPKWWVVDASNQIVGRMATKIATILQGKHCPTYTPHVDTGDYVVVINAEKVALTGTNKRTQRVYKNYTGYPSGQKLKTVQETFESNPEHVLEAAVRRMMPKTKLGETMFKKLKVVAGPEHNFQAQNPVKLEL